ncbi:hypothetical protein KIN20_016621 [Parelaphostrongylus tenuis]|uniref:Uncharacterized protein n=1 Tax=Parelaphostrongylus tenuis TaxID=148309 RepID=A0AAD5QTA6_PARTN|nr:hypothetical protein KIN20_016621 [Parelaphostrongylus tenuis]
MRDKTFALEMDGCSSGENALCSFFAHFSPSCLHLSGRFDRSLISDQVLPLSSLHSLFIEINVSDLETPTRISGVTVRNVLDNWSTRYSGTPR